MYVYAYWVFMLSVCGGECICLLGIYINCVCLVDMFWGFTHFSGDNGVTERDLWPLLRTPGSVCRTTVGNSLCWDRKAGSAMNSSSSRGENREGHEQNRAKGLH